MEGERDKGGREGRKEREGWRELGRREGGRDGRGRREGRRRDMCMERERIAELCQKVFA